MAGSGVHTSAVAATVRDMTTTAQPPALFEVPRTGRLFVHTSERADVLVGELAAVLAADPPADPFAAEVVAVPTRGVERWVAQRLSHRLGALGIGVGGEAGVCANVVFDSPSRVLHRVVATASGIDPDADPWDRERLAWHVLRVVDAAVAAGEAWAAPLARFLTDPPGQAASDGVREARRMRLAQRVAALFAAYGSQRPSLVTSWADGTDDDGAGGPLPPDLAWQPPLWRAVREAAGVPSPAERLASATAVLRDDPDAVDLPARLSVFGPTRLPESELDVLDALGAHREVHLWLPHPSPALWRRATGGVDGDGPGGARPAPRRADVAVSARHPLLGSLGRDATELSLRLAARGVEARHHPAPTPPETVLGALQASLRADERPDPGSRLVAPDDDRTIQVHACHGRSRQVEVLREAVVGLLADDPTLQPRDVVVLCPDVEAFAPLVNATFGATFDRDTTDDADPHPGRTLRVRIADRAPARTNPMLRVVSDLLTLAGSRVTASAVVDLAGLEAVRRRFGFDDDALERLRAWTLASGVRWGEDAARRSRFGVRVGQGTWAAAMDRLLLGVAMSDDDYRHLDATLPLDDVGSTEVDLAGRFAELVDRLTGLLAELEGTRPATAWFDTLDRALVLLADTAPADQWQRVEARGVLADARAAASTAASPDGGALLRLPDVVALLERRLAGRPTRAGFRTGALTVCSLEPMRAVPHRVVCLLGLDDTAFPRVGAVSGDDALARDPLVGERDRRSEDRQLFLDAVLAATDHLVVVHSGADERTGRPLPPAVPVGELLDSVDECVVFPGGPGGAPRDARAALVVHHPLQTVDERNFVPGALGRRGPFSFDDLERRAAFVGRRERVGRRPLLDSPLSPVLDDDATVGLEGTTGLVPTLEHPAKAFVRGRLGVSLPRDEDDLEDRLPLELDSLDGWAAGDRILAAVLDGGDLDVAASAERLRGRMPPGRLGSAALQGITDNVAAVAAESAPFVRVPAATLDVTVSLPDGRTVTGTVPGIRRGGEHAGHSGTVVRALYSRLAAKHRLRAWVQLLALVAGGAPVTSAVTIGRGQGRRPSAVARRLVAPSRDEARELLAGLVAVRDLALREPLPLPVDQAERYASRRADGEEPGVILRDLDDRMVADRRFRGPDAFEALAWGDGWRLSAVAGLPSDDERGLVPGEPTRFGVLARAVWDPLLAHERAEGSA
ncbi:Exodeoxyribonuclease V [Luteimicrobium xylanilyticum]|uniref:RecBCD enzyme subunit RecC n=2 Tax=Luteimicrobium xylanilyticum TaxID=1133546 RepID=A0A5P9Q995_9MICO|nr:Exodeoxyribonuclease V [Luteimicrobium xylanilyticum]